MPITSAMLCWHDICYGTSEIPTLADADRHINVSFMKISHSPGVEN